MQIKRPRTTHCAIAEFKRVARAIQPDALTSKAIELRALAHADSRRYYHGILHPLNMLRVFYSLDAVVEKLEERAVEVAFMVLDHDVLCQPVAAYGANEVGSAAWAEFAPFVSRDRFNTGRAKWAQNFLARKRIFHTEQFRHLEDQARTNLSRLAATA